MAGIVFTLLVVGIVFGVMKLRRHGDEGRVDLYYLLHTFTYAYTAILLGLLVNVLCVEDKMLMILRGSV